MNISCIRILVFLLLLTSYGIQAQDRTTVFHEHEFAFRRTVTKNYSTNFALSSQAFAHEDKDLLYRVQQVQLNRFSTLKLDLKHSIALGVMYRNRDLFEGVSHEIRLTQQFNRKSILKTLHFDHRFISEQRFYDDFTAFRFR